MESVASSRRDILKAGGAAAAAVVLTGVQAACGTALGEESAVAPPNRKRVLRIAHLTDVHVQPELAADQGLVACLHHVQKQQDPPNVIFNGGDAVMDCLAEGAFRTHTLWQLWNDTLRKECSLPVEHCIGNHDIWGWNKQKSGATGKESKFGKQWALDALGLAERYRSFDRAGWHFIVLDSTNPARHGIYDARLDQEQFEWLAEDLKKTGAHVPICVLSHIPIISASAYFDGQNEKSDLAWVVPGAWMHLDARRIKNLFLKHPNVRLCLSGHIHLVDRVDYNGVTYLCNGAVCGDWWRGRHQECDSGYALVDLYNDGSFSYRYVEFGWKSAHGELTPTGFEPVLSA